MAPPLDHGQVIIPSKISLSEGKTTPPKLLSESELIDQMNKNGIGTDATMHDHIQTIQKRHYAIKNNFFFTPTPLGLALCNSYEKMGLTLSKPDLRAQMERLLTSIADGATTKEIVLQQVMESMKEIYKQVELNRLPFIQNVGQQLREAVSSSVNTITSTAAGSICGGCGDTMALETATNARQMNCEKCQKIHTLPKNGQVIMREESCPLCNFQVVQINTDAGKSYTLCPHCLNNPPYTSEEQTGLNLNNQPDSVFKRITMACFQCMNKQCSLAGGFKKAALIECPCCDSPVQIRNTKNDNKPFIGCSKYPECNWSAFFPKDINALIPLDEDCVQCQAKNRKSKLVEVQFDQDGQYATLCGMNKVCLYPGCNPHLEEAGVRFKEVKRLHRPQQQQRKTQPEYSQQQQSFNRNQPPLQSSNRALPQGQERFNQQISTQHKQGINNYAQNASSGGNTSSQLVCFHCYKTGHTKFNCPEKGNPEASAQTAPRQLSQDAPPWQQKQDTQQLQNNLAHFICTNCGKKGHLKSSCRQKPTQKASQQAPNTIQQNHQTEQAQDKPKRQLKACELCGLTRHAKTSNCPNKKAI